MKVIEIEIEIKEAWRIAEQKKKEREIMGIKVGRVEKRREIMEKKKKGKKKG